MQYKYTQIQALILTQIHTHTCEVSLATGGPEKTSIERLYFSAYDHLTAYWIIVLLVESIRASKTFDREHKADIDDICKSIKTKKKMEKPKNVLRAIHQEFCLP